MRERIDWAYIARAEGGRQTKIYTVENAANAGPTIATGFDLGARRIGDLKALGLGPDLVRKLAPYAGKKGLDAARFVAENPLEISGWEAGLIDRLAKKNRDAVRPKIRSGDEKEPGGHPLSRPARRHANRDHIGGLAICKPRPGAKNAPILAFHHRPGLAWRPSRVDGFQRQIPDTPPPGRGVDAQISAPARARRFSAVSGRPRQGNLRPALAPGRPLF